jgi:hypothetical protein
VFTQKLHSIPNVDFDLWTIEPFRDSGYILLADLNHLLKQTTYSCIQNTANKNMDACLVLILNTTINRKTLSELYCLLAWSANAAIRTGKAYIH